MSNSDNVSTFDVTTDEVVEALDMVEHDSSSSDDVEDVDDATDKYDDDLETVPLRRSCEGASFSSTFFLCF